MQKSLFWDHINHQRLPYDPIVATHQIFDFLHVLYHQIMDIDLIPNDKRSAQQQEFFKHNDPFDSMVKFHHKFISFILKNGIKHVLIRKH